jgi:tetratricopeptide (TPR) repeat protein
MRLSEAAAQLLYHAVVKENLSDNYELCIELARMNYHLACNTKDAIQAKRDIEAAVSTTRHCIRLLPDKPDAYALLARITAQHPEGVRFSDEAYEHFKAAIQAHPRINWMVAANITYTHWLRNRYSDMSIWRDRWREVLDKNLWQAEQLPFNPDRFAFSALAEIFRLSGMPGAFEEYLQTAFLLYPSKSAQLIRYYLRRLCLRKFGHSLLLFLRSVDKQEARLRHAYMRSRPSDRAKMIYELTDVNVW